MMDMNTKQVYELIEDVDNCLLSIEVIRELTELFRSGFEMNNNKSGVIAADLIIKQLQNVDLDLNGVHGKLDRYGLIHMD